MIALDTNVLARFYISPASDEDRKQADQAEAILASERTLFVPITVSLELAWLLKAVYEQGPAAIKRVFDHLSALPNITVEDAGALAQATEWHIKGLEFADALHLAKSSTCTGLVTFDSLFLKRARRLASHPAVAASA